LLRSELIIWGTHIYKCFCLFEETTDEIYEFNIENVMNLVLFYSVPLFDFVIKRSNLKDSHQLQYFVDKNVLMHVESHVLTNAFTEKEQALKALVLLNLLKMEKSNSNLSLTEIISNTFLNYLLANFFKKNYIELKSVINIIGEANSSRLLTDTNLVSFNQLLTHFINEETQERIEESTSLDV
jgi:hypothetical protein